MPPKNLLLLLLILVGILITSMFFRFFMSSNQGTGTTFAHEAIERSSEDNVVVLDVRTNTEFAAEHAKPAQHFPLAQLQNGEIPSIDRKAEIYVYCRSGNRSARAIEILQQHGYQNLVNMGSLDQWKEAGGETLN